MGCVKVCLVTRLEKHSGVTQNFRVMQKQPCPFTVYVHVRKYHCMIDKSFSVDPVLRHQRYQQEIVEHHTLKFTQVLGLKTDLK